MYSYYRLGRTKLLITSHIANIRQHAPKTIPIYWRTLFLLGFFRFFMQSRSAIAPIARNRIIINIATISSFHYLYYSLLYHIVEEGWFKNSRFRSLSSKPTFLFVVTDLIIAYFGIVEGVNTYSWLNLKIK